MGWSLSCLAAACKVVLALLLLASSLSAQTVELRQTSVPVGIVNQRTSVPLNSAQVTQTAPDTNSGYTWAYWTLNAVRWEHASGAAENPTKFIANGAVDAVATYFPGAYRRSRSSADASA